MEEISIGAELCVSTTELEIEFVRVGRSSAKA